MLFFKGNEQHVGHCHMTLQQRGQCEDQLPRHHYSNNQAGGDMKPDDTVSLLMIDNKEDVCTVTDVTTVVSDFRSEACCSGCLLPEGLRLCCVSGSDL